MNVREIGWEGVVCMHLAQDRDMWQTLPSNIKISDQQFYKELATVPSS